MPLEQAPPAAPAPSHIDSGDYTYDKLFHVQPLPPPWPDQADARLAALETEVRELRQRLRVQERALMQTHEQAQLEMNAFAVRVRVLERYLHRLLNQQPALIIPTGDEND